MGGGGEGAFALACVPAAAGTQGRRNARGAIPGSPCLLEEMGLWAETGCAVVTDAALGRKACALAWLLLGCVALGKLLSFSGP